MSQHSETNSSEAAEDIASCVSSESNETISESLINNIRNLNTKLKYSQALESYNEVVLFNVNYANTVFEKGLLAAKKRKFKQAVGYIDMALAIVPESDYYLTSKGVSLHNMKKFQEAIECYDQALLINPHSAVTFNFKGIALLNIKSYEQSIVCFENAIRLNSGFASAIKFRRIALCCLKKSQKTTYNLGDMLEMLFH